MCGRLRSRSRRCPDRRREKEISIEVNMTQRDCILTVYKGLRKFSAKRVTQQGRRSRLILFSAFAFSLISRISPAQTIESEVEGSITDPSGGLISPAEVVLIMRGPAELFGR